MNALYIISPLTALLLTLLITPLLRLLAIKLKLVDQPNYRKVHQANVPLIGGISIFIATSASLLLALPFTPEINGFGNIFFALTILLLMGLVDDRYDLNALLKLAVQLILAHFIFSQGIKIQHLHGLMGIHTIDPWLQYTLTVLLITGFVNAFNLMDGIDGLAAGIAALNFTLFGIFATLLQRYDLALLSFTLLGSITAFIRFNLSKYKKVFLGDAGSLILGFWVVITAIELLNSAQNNPNSQITAFFVVAVMFIPVIDAIRVFSNRILTGKGVFSGDKTHLHHLILAMNLKHPSATLLILVIASCIMAVGFIFFLYFGITLSVVSMLLAFFGIVGLVKFNNKLRYWKVQIKAMERTPLRL